MRLIVGLGNPGEKYKNTRHNVGFMVLDTIQKIGIKEKNIIAYRLENRYEALITQAEVDKNNKIIFAKPQTYMNLSGNAVKKIKNYYKIEDEDIFVVCDDLNLNLGTVRVRNGGSDGGHNGLKSIISQIGEKFWRIRVGVGSSDLTNSQSDLGKVNIDLEKFVLEKFPITEQKKINMIVDKTANYVLESISWGIKDTTLKYSL
jgi:PTH1 family peptidyl-tRNA hydrolase